MITTVFNSADLVGINQKDRNSHLLIAGNLLNLGAAISGRVRLFSRATGLLVAESLADQNGKYRFYNLISAEYFIVAHHPRNQYNAVIQDMVVPK